MVLSSTLHDLVQINLQVSNNESDHKVGDDGMEFLEGNEVNETLRSVINFQNALMKELIHSQYDTQHLSNSTLGKNNFSDVEFNFDEREEVNFSRTKFLTIEPIRKVKTNCLRFYVSKKALHSFPSALEAYQSKCDLQLEIFPQIDVHLNIAPQTDSNLYSIFVTGLELVTLCGEFTIDKPIKYELSSYVPKFMSDYCENLNQGTLFSLIIVTNSLFSSRLLDLLCTQVALMIKGKSTEQIREKFNIQNGKFSLTFPDFCQDFTPEEEESVRRENEWAYEE